MNRKLRAGDMVKVNPDYFRDYPICCDGIDVDKTYTVVWVTKNTKHDPFAMRLDGFPSDRFFSTFGFDLV